jgi:hypothetical protein
MALATVASAKPLDHREAAALLRIELVWRCSPSPRSFLRPEAHVVVVHVGRLPSPLVHWLARSIIVHPPPHPDKRDIAQGGGCHPTVVSPTAVEWSSYLDQLEGSPTAAWSWLKLEKPPRPISMGRGSRFSLPHWESWGSLDGASHHGSLQERWLTAGGAHDDDARAVPKGGRGSSRQISWR